MRSSRIYRTCFGLSLAFLALILLLPANAAAEETGAEGEKVTNISVLGRRATRFAPEDADTLEKLKELTAQNEADIRALLEMVEWQGNPDDLFNVIRDAKEGDPAVHYRAVNKGETFPWMAYRRKGKPDVFWNVRWASNKPMDAWNVEVASEGHKHTFMVPQACLNFAFEKSEPLPPPPPPPTCDLSASFDANQNLISVSGVSSASDFVLTGFKTPSGAANVSDLKSAGTNRWTYTPQADGTFAFSAKATSDDGERTSVCEANVSVTRKKPVCSMTATVDPETNVITLDAGSSEGDLTLTGVTLPDGTAGDLTAMQTAGDMRWTFDPGESLPRKPGDYTYTFQALVKLHDNEATCKATATVSKVKECPSIIVRGFGGFTATTHEEDKMSTMLDGGAQEHQTFDLENGWGFGAGVEYLPCCWMGVEADFIYSNIETHFMVDRDNYWGKDEQDLNFWMISLGANFHLTKDYLADVYVGPFIGFAAYDDVSFTDMGITYKKEIDDEFIYGLKVGVDVPFGWGNPWAFTGGFRWLALTTDVKGEDLTVDMNPIIVTAGIAYRY